MITTWPRLAYHTSEDATSSRAPFYLDYWVGKYPKRLILWPEPNCRILMQKYFNLRILKEKFHRKYFWDFPNYQWRLEMEFRKYLVMISHLEGASNGRRPNQFASPRPSRSNPMFCPTVIKRDMPRKKQDVNSQNSTFEIYPRPLTSFWSVAKFWQHPDSEQSNDKLCY